jgi:serine/threonine-protein kinase
MTSRDPLIGTLLAGRFEIDACIGAGAMGAVYRANQLGLGRSVALKILKKDLTWGGDTVARFRREAQAMSALTHPHTVRVFDFGATDDGLLYLAMELLEGELATQALQRQGRLPVVDAIRYTQQVLRSIGEAHAKKIIHRDLKPDNLFIARVEGESRPIVKVLDFGIAKAVEGERKLDQFETQDGTVFGTPRYMSPEQAQGKALDNRSDLYAVGIILYEFLTGAPPFVDPDAVVVMAKHIREQPAPPSKAAPDQPIPGSLEQVVKKALEKDPTRRFASADEFEAALAACVADAEAMEQRSLQAGASLARLSDTAVKALGGGRTGARRGLALAAVVALALVTWLAWPTPAAQPPAGTDDQPGPAAATGPAPTTRRVVTVTSTPEEAEVFRDGVSLGVTPLDVAVGADSAVRLQLRKKGFQVTQVDLGARDGARSVMMEPEPAPQPETGGAGGTARVAPEPAAPSAADSRPQRQRPRHRTRPERGSPEERAPYEKF